MRYFFLLILALLAWGPLADEPYPARAELPDVHVLVVRLEPRVLVRPWLSLAFPDVRQPPARLVNLERATACRERLSEHTRGTA